MTPDPNADPLTFERLVLLGVAPGWRGLEIAGGGGSVVRWLADRVGPHGAVAATDVDDLLAPGDYDLVHSRAVARVFVDAMLADVTPAARAGAARPRARSRRSPAPRRGRSRPARRA
jgi:predicted methyltransferase